VNALKGRLDARTFSTVIKAVGRRELRRSLGESVGCAIMTRPRALFLALPVALPRNKTADFCVCFEHIGLYAYSKDCRGAALAPSSLIARRKIEGLGQLTRAAPRTAISIQVVVPRAERELVSVTRSRILEKVLFTSRLAGTGHGNRAALAFVEGSSATRCPPPR